LLCLSAQPTMSEAEPSDYGVTLIVCGGAGPYGRLVYDIAQTFAGVPDSLAAWQRSSSIGIPHRYRRPRQPCRRLEQDGETELQGASMMGKYLLGWLLGVPVVVLVIIYLIFN